MTDSHKPMRKHDLCHWNGRKATITFGVLMVVERPAWSVRDHLKGLRSLEKVDGEMKHFVLSDDISEIQFDSH